MFLLHLRADVAHGDHLVVLHIVLENGQPSVGQFNTYFDISTLANNLIVIKILIYLRERITAAWTGISSFSHSMTMSKMSVLP